MAHTPYMRITLSTRPLSALAGNKHVTYQPIPLPPAPKRSKAKAREQRRALQAKSREQAQESAGDAHPAAGDGAAYDAGDVVGGPLTALAGRIAEAAKAGKEKRRPVEVLEKAGSSKKKRVAA
jgi:predicted DsbA family dithiol-disulfide isomerase